MLEIFSVVVSAGAGVAGLVVGTMRWMAARILGHIETRLERLDALEARLDALAADLPLHYRRQDECRRDHAAADERCQRTIDGLGRALERLERSRAEDMRRYQLRDDAIREYAALAAKLDRLYEVLVEIRRE